jgi:TonB family protein
MYFDFEDYHPDITPVGQAISWREGVLLSIIAHLVFVILLLVVPRWFPFLFETPRPRIVAQQRPPDQTRFVFVQPRLERPVTKAPDRADASDLNRMARSPERAPKPTNDLPFSRGNTPERVDEPPKQTARGEGPQPDPAAGQPTQNTTPDPSKLPDSQSALQLPSRTPGPQNGANGRSATAGGSLGDALRNLQRYTQSETFDNQGGNGGQFGPEIQFDTKGVEFGPWIRRFIAQVKRNWFIPYAAMSQKGHVVIQFNVHKDGAITDLNVAGPSVVDAFNNAAFGALSGSNPTQPLPPEYPADKAFFTVTFFYNEAPPR